MGETPMKNLRIAIVALRFVASSCFAALAQTPAVSNAEAPARVPGLDLNSIDKTADPCVDFFQYACGNFSKLHPIPPDHASFANFDILMDANETILRGLLEKAAAGGANRTANEQKIGDLYAKAKRDQWNADVAIDWSTPVDTGGKILDGERMQAELRLHAAEQILARLEQADPYHVAEALYPGAGHVDCNVCHAFAVCVGAGVDHPRFGADVRGGGFGLHRSNPVCRQS